MSTAQAHPEVPVVDNLEDIWLVSKLQEERKAKQKHQEHAQQLQHYKQVTCSSFGLLLCAFPCCLPEHSRSNLALSFQAL